MWVLVALMLFLAGLCNAAPNLPSGLVAPCDPGFGKPRPSAGCPDPDPVTGWLTRSADGRLVLTSYGTRHPRPLRLEPATVCTGAITVGYAEPLHDHLVDCDELGPALRRHHRIRVAVWSAEGQVVQLSELYHP